VKDNAYGHGLVTVASEAVAAGAAWWVTNLTGQVWFRDTSTYGLPIPDPGYSYTLTFRSIPGFQAPANPSSPVHRGISRFFARARA